MGDRTRPRYVEEFSFRDRQEILAAYMSGEWSMPNLGVLYETSAGTIACLLHAQAMLEGRYEKLLLHIVEERYNSGRHRKNQGDT